MAEYQWRGWPYIRAMHPYGFRCGEWAELLTVGPANGDSDLTLPGDCYVVRFPDGVTDFWPVYDDDARYEFSISGTLNERSEG